MGRHLGTAEQPVDAQAYRHLGRLKRGFRGLADHLEIAGGAADPDLLGQKRQCLGVDPDVLEPDVLEAERQHQVDHLEAIGDSPGRPL